MGAAMLYLEQVIDEWDHGKGRAMTIVSDNDTDEEYVVALNQIMFMPMQAWALTFFRLQVTLRSLGQFGSAVLQNG
jgi:hypothetical protein